MVKTIEDIKYFIIPELYDYLKNAESGEGADITALETAVEALETAIGDESTEGSILYRLKALEDAQTPTTEETTENTEPTEPANP